MESLKSQKCSVPLKMSGKSVENWLKCDDSNNLRWWTKWSRSLYKWIWANWLSFRKVYVLFSVYLASQWCGTEIVLISVFTAVILKTILLLFISATCWQSLVLFHKTKVRPVCYVILHILSDLDLTAPCAVSLYVHD